MCGCSALSAPKAVRTRPRCLYVNMWVLARINLVCFHSLPHTAATRVPLDRMHACMPRSRNSPMCCCMRRRTEQQQLLRRCHAPAASRWAARAVGPWGVVPWRRQWQWRLQRWTDSEAWQWAIGPRVCQGVKHAFGPSCFNRCPGGILHTAAARCSPNPSAQRPSLQYMTVHCCATFSMWGQQYQPVFAQCNPLHSCHTVSWGAECGHA